jgi:hypothetical protein
MSAERERETNTERLAGSGVYFFWELRVFKAMSNALFLQFSKMVKAGFEGLP